MDPAYFPLVTSAISGTVGLASIGVALLVLSLNHRALRNPLRVELYKKQIEAAGKISKHARQSHYFVYEWIVKKGSGQEEVAKRALDFAELYLEYEAYMQEVVRCVCVKYWQSLLDVVRAKGAEAMIAAVNKEAEQMAWLVKYCRRFSGAEILTDEMHPEFKKMDDLAAAGANMAVDFVIKRGMPNPEIHREEMQELKQSKMLKAIDHPIP